MDEMEQENWQLLAAKYPRERMSRLTMSLWEFTRKTMRVNPRKVSKSQMESRFRKLALNKPVAGLKPGTERYKAAKLKASPFYGMSPWERNANGQWRRDEFGNLIQSKKYLKPQGMWSKGLYAEVRSIHQMRSPKGTQYARTYRMWTDSEIQVIGASIPLEQKASLLGRSEASVRRKMLRL